MYYVNKHDFMLIGQLANMSVDVIMFLELISYKDF